LITSNRQEVIDKNLFEASVDSQSSKNLLVVIEPTKQWLNLDLLGIWKYRELLYFLGLRDVQIRYKQTLIGIIWVVLQPILTTIVFSILFSSIGQGAAQDIPYPLFAFSGFTIWTFFNAAIFNSSNSLVNHTGLITKVFFPRLIIPISAVGASLLDLLFGLLSLLVVMLIYQATPSWTIIFAPLFLLIILL
jgi:lipopolysaccharide transport system permease protein